MPAPPHLEEEAKLHAAVVLEVVALVQRLVHVHHAQREGLACHLRDVGRCGGGRWGEDSTRVGVTAQLSGQTKVCPMA